MMHLQLGIQGSSRPTGKFESGSHGEGSRMIFRGMSGRVLFVSRIREHTFPAGLLQSLPISDGKCENISMDFNTSLP